MVPSGFLWNFQEHIASTQCLENQYINTSTTHNVYRVRTSGTHIFSLAFFSTRRGILHQEKLSLHQTTFSVCFLEFVSRFTLNMSDCRYATWYLAGANRIQYMIDIRISFGFISIFSFEPSSCFEELFAMSHNHTSRSVERTFACFHSNE